MGDIIHFPTYEGNGAPAAITRYVEENTYDEYLKTKPDLVLLPVDHMLIWLWSEGFKVVPVTGDE